MTDLLRSTSKSRPNLSRVFSVLAGCFLVCLSAGNAVAEESPWSIRGFGTVGVARTNTDNAEFIRDLSQPRGIVNRWDAKTDSLLGLQASYQFSPQLEGVVQAVTRYRYDRSYTPDITWAFLKYEPVSNVSLRAGRLGTEFFMLSDSRLVGYSYLTVRPPGDFFWHLPFYSIEGADAAVSVPVGDGAILRGKVFTGISHEKVALAEEYWDLSGSRMSGGYLDYANGPWLLRASYSNIRFSNNLPIETLVNQNCVGPCVPQQVLSYLATAGTDADYYSLGVVYDRGPWQVQVMLNDIRQGSHAFQNSRTGYVLAGYRVGALTPFVGYSRVISKKPSDTGNGVIDYVVEDSRVQQSTWMLGARWDVAHNVALKVQADLVRGTPDTYFPYRREVRGSWSGNMNVLSATLDFVF